VQDLLQRAAVAGVIHRAILADIFTRAGNAADRGEHTWELPRRSASAWRRVILAEDDKPITGDEGNAFLQYAEAETLRDLLAFETGAAVIDGDGDGDIVDLAFEVVGLATEAGQRADSLLHPDVDIRATTARRIDRVCLQAMARLQAIRDAAADIAGGA
jgi:hypothetical protein